MAQVMILDAAFAAAAGQTQGMTQTRDAAAGEVPQFGDVLSTAATALDLAMLFEMPGSGEAPCQGEDKAAQAVALENLAAGAAPKADAAEQVMEAIAELVPEGPASDGEAESGDEKQPSESVAGNMLAALMPTLAIANQPVETAQVMTVADGAEMPAPASGEALPVTPKSVTEAPNAAVTVPEAETPTADVTRAVAEPFVEVLDKVVSEVLAAATGETPATGKQVVEKSVAPETPAASEQKLMEAATAPVEMPEPDIEPKADTKPKTAIDKAAKAEETPAAQRTLPAQAHVEIVQARGSGKTTHAATEPTDEDKVAVKPAAPSKDPADVAAATGNADDNAAVAKEQPKAPAEGPVAQAVRPAVQAVVAPVVREVSSEREAAPTQAASEGQTRAADGVHALKSDVPARAADVPQTRSDAARADQERIIARISETITQAEQGGRSTVRLRLYPPELGTVRVEVTSVRGTITARIETSTAQAHGAINSSLTALRSQLEDSGVNVRDVQVQYRGAAQFGLADRESRQGGYQAPRQRTSNGRDEAVEAIEPAGQFVEATASGKINLLA